jgi:hypothetical protein
MKRQAADSKDNLESELQVSRAFRRRNDSEGRVSYLRVGNPELRRVHDVEGFGSELKSNRFVEREVLVDSKVEIHRARSFGGTDSKVPSSRVMVSELMLVWMFVIVTWAPLTMPPLWSRIVPVMRAVSTWAWRSCAQKMIAHASSNITRQFAVIANLLDYSWINSFRALTMIGFAWPAG